MGVCVCVMCPSEDLCLQRNRPTQINSVMIRLRTVLETETPVFEWSKSRRALQNFFTSGALNYDTGCQRQCKCVLAA